MRTMQKKENVLSVVIGIYLLCFVFRLLEYFILRTDQTILGEAIVHKLIGIGILIGAIKMLGIHFNDIGYRREHILQEIVKGLLFAFTMFVVAYGVEIAVMALQGNFNSVQLYVSAYAVDKNVGQQTARIFFLICILGNVVNVVMEEGIFRGFFMTILQKKYSFIVSAVISSTLFGLWHMVGPIRNYMDGISSMGGTIANILMLVITSGLVGFKFALLAKMTGSLYMSLGDHFVNNTIVNLLHVVSYTGTDEMMFVRITIAQSVSFILVLAYYIKKYCKKNNS